jgi:hypothetical protein
MSKMNIPEFTAEASLYKTSGCYQSVATRGYRGGEQRVISQIRVGGGFGGFGGLRLGFWCELGCDAAYAACLAACTATGPAAPACVATCTFLYDTCIDAC